MVNIKKLSKVCLVLGCYSLRDLNHYILLFKCDVYSVIMGLFYFNFTDMKKQTFLLQNQIKV